MKACELCYRVFPADGAFCPVDGSPLKPADEVPAQPAGEDGHLGKVLCERYEMRRIVADGGMGRVYEARDLGVPGGRRVAIKVLHPEVSRDPVAVERFRREFEISKDLPHEHIVEVYDFQEIAENRSILVMEFLDGEELRAVLKQERMLRPARLIRMMAQIAIALDEAHRRDFVHRDLKPDNIFLCGGPHGDIVKLLDFGSARINKNRSMSKLTSIGTTIGSPFYMSPEQAQGVENLDQRADVFALGAITYEALCGQVPFPGSNGPAILLALLTKNAAPITTRMADLPSALDDVLDDALAKKPETRTKSAGEFADALGRSFALQGDHAVWAKMPTAEIEAILAQNRVVKEPPPSSLPLPASQQGAVSQHVPPPYSGSAVVADPFATGVAPPASAPAPKSSVDARLAMDASFEAAQRISSVPGVPKRSPLIWLIALVVLGVAVLILITSFQR